MGIPVLNRSLALGAVLLLVASNGAVAGSKDWVTDFALAKTKAAKEKKDLLIDFTGSDWCGWCIRLNKEVFDTEPFKAKAPKHFVLVELDFPQRKPLPPKLREQNELLKEEFGVRGFPTIYLADAKGRPYASIGYRAGGPDEYLKHLENLQGKKKVRDSEFAKADKATGLERARLLDAALKKQAARVGSLTGYDDVIAEIVELDGDNKEGLRDEYLVEVVRGKLREVGRKMSADDAEGALTEIATIVKDLPPHGDARQMVFFYKAKVLYSKEDTEGTLVALRKAHEASPDSEQGRQIAQIIKNIENEAGDE